MRLKNYLILMSLSTLVCWLTLLGIIFNIDPEEAGILGFFLFYLALLLSLIGTLALLGFLIRIKTSEEPTFRKVVISFRQAIWFSLLIVFFLSLKAQDLLRWWNVSLFILFLVLLELSFILRKRGI
jgi:hypothetical protein